MSDFSRDRVWTFDRTLVVVLRGLVKALSRETCDFLDLLGDDSLPVNTGASGLRKARAKLKYQVFRELLRRTSRHFYANCGNVRLEGGYRLLGIDTSIMLPPEDPRGQGNSFEANEVSNRLSGVITAANNAVDQN